MLIRHYYNARPLLITGTYGITVLVSLHVLLCLILATILAGNIFNPHFIDGEVKGQRC